MPSSRVLANKPGNLQLQVGKQVSIYSEKAFRRNQGEKFEAVGNVVIKTEAETLYGERASFDMQTGVAIVEGNVRFINESLTVYGSQIYYESATTMAEVKNARVVTSFFNVNARNLKRLGPKLYKARDAEFTTCTDCIESWTIFGDEIDIELGNYVYIKGAQFKIKGVNAIYIPYLVLPIKNTRESGLLFPKVSSRFNEGLGIEQPIYWAISDANDFTLTPGFYGQRGMGGQLEYRHEFGEERWLRFNQKLVNDKIYLPYKVNRQISGQEYFRNFYSFDTHYSWSHDTYAHLSATGMKDLDFPRDNWDFADDYLRHSDVGVSGFVEKHSDSFTLGVESSMRRNLIVDDPEILDQKYVQVLPSVYFSYAPHTLMRFDRSWLYHLSTGMDAEFTAFRPMDANHDSATIRTASRWDINPYLKMEWFNIGPVQSSTTYHLSFQDYRLPEEKEKYFMKYASRFTTEISFGLDRIYGLAYTEQVDVDEVEIDSLSSDQQNANVNENLKDSNFIGQLPSFEKSLTSDTVKIVSNSYRHSQEFKLLHHLIDISKEEGSSKFGEQIESNTGWFDYQDAVLENYADVGSRTTRMSIPLKNTLEFQWNNNLIRKTANVFEATQDKRYLRDNFNYNRIGFFNLSQGLLLDQSSEIKENENADEFKYKLSRLLLHGGYFYNRWTFEIKDYYFHVEGRQILDSSVSRRFDSAAINLGYTQNSLEENQLQIGKLGLQVLPWDVFGFSYIQEMDVQNNQNIRSIYQADIMPQNNCFILSFNYRQSVNEQRFAFNFLFNFGGDEFKNYKNNFFSLNRVR